jgi:hypothetical protein
VGDALYYGSRLVGCATAGHIIEGLPEGGPIAGTVFEQTCGMATEKSPSRLDSYGVFRMSVGTLLGPFGPAWEVLSDDSAEAN